MNTWLRLASSSRLVSLCLQHQVGPMTVRCMSTADRSYPAEPRVGVGVVILRPGRRDKHAPEVHCCPSAKLKSQRAHMNRLLKVLLIKRGKAPSKGLWSFPGGSQELGAA